jgi:hypothetical protein
MHKEANGLDEGDFLESSGRVLVAKRDLLAHGYTVHSRHSYRLL